MGLFHSRRELPVRYIETLDDLKAHFAEYPPGSAVYPPLSVNFRILWQLLLRIEELESRVP